MRSLFLTAMLVALGVAVLLVTDVVPPTPHNSDVVVLAASLAATLVLAVGLWIRQIRLERRAKSYEARLREIEQIVAQHHPDAEVRR